MTEKEKKSIKKKTVKIGGKDFEVFSREKNNIITLQPLVEYIKTQNDINKIIKLIPASIKKAVIKNVIRREIIDKVKEIGKEDLIYKFVNFDDYWTELRKKDKEREIKKSIKKSTEPTKTIEELKEILKNFKFEADIKGITVFYGKDCVCNLSFADNKHLKLSSSRNPLNIYLKRKGLLSDKLITALQNYFEKRRKSEIKKAEKKHAPTKIKPNLSIKTWDQLKKIVEDNLPERLNDFKIILYTVVSYFFNKGDVIYIGIVSPPSTGKSTLCKCFPDSKFVVSIDGVTMESFAPGTAKEDENVSSLLDLIIDKTLIIHDLTSILGSGELKVEKFFTMIDNAFGEEPYKKHSPGTGIKERGGGFNFIFGLIPELFYRYRRRFTRTGRYLIYELTKVDQIKMIIEKKTHPNVKKIKPAVQGFLINLNKSKKSKKGDIIIPEEIYYHLAEFFRILPAYRLVWRNWNKKNKKLENKYILHREFREAGIWRPYNQLEMLLKAKCFIEGRTVITFEDVKFFKPLFYGLDSPMERILKLQQIPFLSKKRFELFGVKPPKETGIKIDKKSESKGTVPETSTPDLSSEEIEELEF